MLNSEKQVSASIIVRRQSYRFSNAAFLKRINLMNIIMQQELNSSYKFDLYNHNLYDPNIMVLSEIGLTSVKHKKNDA